MQERSCVLSFSTFFAKYFCSDFRFSKFLQVHFLLFCSQVFSRTYFSPYTGSYASAVSYVPSFMGLHVFQNVLECYFVLVFSEFLQNIFVQTFWFSKFLQVHFLLFCSQVFSRTPLLILIQGCMHPLSVMYRPLLHFLCSRTFLHPLVLKCSFVLYFFCKIFLSRLSIF